MPEAVSQPLQINQCGVRLTKGDLTDLDVDAFVFYAQNDLALGSGSGTAISVRGGPPVQRELEGLEPVATGEAVATAGGGLKAGMIIHAVGPKFREDDIEGKLRTTMRNALELAEEKGVRRIAFPAMGAGYYGIAPDVCARVMLDAIQTHLQGESRLEELIICVLDTRQYEAFRAQLATLS